MLCARRSLRPAWSERQRQDHLGAGRRRNRRNERRVFALERHRSQLGGPSAIANRLRSAIHHQPRKSHRRGEYHPRPPPPRRRPLRAGTRSAGRRVARSHQPWLRREDSLETSLRRAAPPPRPLHGIGRRTAPAPLRRGNQRSRRALRTRNPRLTPPHRPRGQPRGHRCHPRTARSRRVRQSRCP